MIFRRAKTAGPHPGEVASLRSREEPPQNKLTKKPHQLKLKTELGTILAALLVSTALGKGKFPALKTISTTVAYSEPIPQPSPRLVRDYSMVEVPDSSFLNPSPKKEPNHTEMSTAKDQPRIVSSDEATRPSRAPDQEIGLPWRSAAAARRKPRRRAAKRASAPPGLPWRHHRAAQNVGSTPRPPCTTGVLPGLPWRHCRAAPSGHAPPRAHHARQSHVLTLYSIMVLYARALIPRARSAASRRKRRVLFVWTDTPSPRIRSNQAITMLMLTLALVTARSPQKKFDSTLGYPGEGPPPRPTLGLIGMNFRGLVSQNRLKTALIEARIMTYSGSNIKRAERRRTTERDIPQ